MILHHLDNVEVVTESQSLKAPIGTKMARHFIRKGNKIYKYGVAIGKALENIQVGQVVSESNIHEDGTSTFEDINVEKFRAFSIPDRLNHFWGYPSISSTFGTRNYLAIHTSVQCVEGIMKYVVERLQNEVLNDFPHVDGIVLLTHNYGCGVAIDANNSDIPKRTLVSLALNPNFGGYGLFVGLGCEKLRHKWLIENIFKKNTNDEYKYDAVYFQSIDERGFEGIVGHLKGKIIKALEKANLKRRIPAHICNLRIGSQCGGSDGLSGITSNPLLGAVSDIIVKSGGVSVFSETTECIPGEGYLLSRCIDLHTKDKLHSEFKWYKNYLASSGVSHVANTTPGNKKGGLSSIIEKSLGSISKSGFSKIIDVIASGNMVEKKGLTFLSGPASDFVCGTNLLASGCNLQIFTTGRGTPYSIDGMPVLKVSSNSDLYRKWHDLIDFDAGRLLEGDTFEDLTVKLLEKIVNIASGEKTCTEKLGIKNSMVLFNPAAIT